MLYLIVDWEQNLTKMLDEKVPALKKGIDDILFTVQGDHYAGLKDAVQGLNIPF